MVSARQWPALEQEFLGKIVRRSWNGEYRNTEQIRSDVVEILGDEGWEVEGEDILRGLDITFLFPVEEV